MIFKNIDDLVNHVESKNELLIVTSGGFDPMHVGHLRCLINTAATKESFIVSNNYNSDIKVAVIVNDDGFLLRKKGYAFMPIDERMEIIDGVKGIDYVTCWDDGSQTVVGALEKLNPIAFTKGGDRNTADNVPEYETCNNIGCILLFNIGGGKIQSSSSLVESIRK